MTTHPPAPAAPRATHQPSPLSQPPASAAPAQHGGPHMLSLKVMRASAPSLAVSEKPYYDDYDAGDGLLTAIGQGIHDGLSNDLLSNRWEGSSSNPAETFPISSLLVLPNSFGTLYLGETFRTYLCVRNESDVRVREPSLRVEMQVGAADAGQPGEGVRWHQLAHVILPSPTRFSPDLAHSAGDEPKEGKGEGEGEGEEEGEGKPVWELAPGEPLETALGYDIKDLGAHVLVCTVGYKAPVIQDGETTWAERSFRKFYKFSVDRSPISVRTKVHQPRHACSLFHPTAAVRRRVELEVQVQNVTTNGSSLVLQGLAFKPAQGWGWRSVDRPSLGGAAEKRGADMWVSSHSSVLLADGDVRQYLFTLVPTSDASVSDEALRGGIDMGTSPDGHAIRGDALGHLDISWRMSLGEPGRLQTSQLVRRRVASNPTALAAPSGGRLAPRLGTQLTLLPRAVQALTDLRRGGEVELEVQLDVCDVSALSLPPGKESSEQPATPAREEDDDDTPLSEISPRARRTDATETLTVRRTLRMALQHCSISSPLSVAPPRAAVASSGVPAHGETQEGGMGVGTPRKSWTPSRTGTPTQVGAKSRLQANLTSLVRNSSLSLRPGRGSSEVSDDSGSIGGSRVGTPTPPAVPPKTPGLLPAKEVTESPAATAAAAEAAEVRVEYPVPVISWQRIAELYSAYVENHSQALTRPPTNTAAPTIPETFLPTHHARFKGQGLIPLPKVNLTLNAHKSTSGTFYAPNPTSEPAAKPEASIQAKLAFEIAHTSSDRDQEAEVVRFGALRILLLGYTDEEEGKQPVHVDTMAVLQEIPVFAEALL